MTVSAVPAMFKAGDGREFEAEDDAAAWEEILEARDSYDEARRLFMNLLAENMLTADGVPFKRLRDYWRVREVHRGMAWLEEVSAYEHGIELHEWDGQASERVQIRIPSRDRDGSSSGLWVVVDIGELYRSRDKAVEAVLESQRKTIEEWKERIETTERNG